jgi:two-component system, NarL family, nitrate/nitrite response regulator NarL
MQVAEAAMEPKSFGTFVVGSNALMREGLVRILSSDDFRIIASAVTASDLVADSISTTDPLLLIVDVGEDFDGAIQEIERFKKKHPTARIAIVAHQHRLDKVVEAYCAGANAYFFKVTSCETFIRSLELVMLGTIIIPPEIAVLFDYQSSEVHDGAGKDQSHANGKHHLLHLADQDGEPADRTTNATTAASIESGLIANLSARQKTILRCLLDGDSNKVIARRIAIAEATVKVHVKAILRKIRVQNRTQAAIWAMHNGPLLTNRDPSAAAAAELSEHACNSACSDIVQEEDQKDGAIVRTQN